MNDGPAKKKLPAWVEPFCIVLFCFTALFEWYHGELFWSFCFALAALLFAATRLYHRLRR